MAYHPPALAQERKREICAAFAEFYEKIPRNGRGKLLAEGGKPAQLGYAYKNGVLLPPPSVLAACYERTLDTRFLFTSEEKAEYQRIVGGILPDQKRWPDRASAEDKPDEIPDVPALERHFVDLTNQIRRLGRLPAKHLEREKARRLLAKPAMQLYSVATELGLEFPEEFRDLLKQLDFAANLNPGAKKRR